MRAKPRTSTVPSYSYEITANGKVIGTLQGFDPSYNRPLEPVRELCSLEDIREIVPGKGTFTLGISRLETYDENLGKAITGDSQDVIPSNQYIPFNIVERVIDPSGKVKRTITYQDCWIQDYRKSLREGGSVLILESVTVLCAKVTVSEG